jgi:hypothetical protein
MLIGLLKVPFQLAVALYDRLDVLAQDLGVVMGDTVGSVFGTSSRRDRNRKAAKIRAELEAERQRLLAEIAKYNETEKWLNEEVVKANEVSLKETKEVELDHAIKEAQTHVNQLKEQVRTSGKGEQYVERGQQYRNDLNQAMIDAAKNHNDALDQNIGMVPDSLTPIPGMTEGVLPGQAPPHTPEGRKIAETRNYLQFVESEVERDPDLRDQKRELVRIADHSLDVASEEFASGNFPAGDFALNIATAALDLALSLTPGIGVGKDVYEGLTGKNLLTGDKLSTIERVFSFVSVATGGIAPVVMKASVGIGIIVKIAKRGAKTAEEAEEIVKIGAKGGDIVDSAKKYDIEAGKLGEEMGRLREATQTQGNFGMGTGKLNKAEFLGESWVGPNAIKKDYPGKPGKKLYISQDGTKQYREAVFKPDLGKTQANYEWRTDTSGKWTGNGHFDVIE